MSEFISDVTANGKHVLIFSEKINTPSNMLGKELICPRNANLALELNAAISVIATGLSAVGNFA